LGSNQWRLQWLAPDLVGRIDLELPIQGVGRNHGGLAAIEPGAALVADLSGDARKAGQTGHRVLRADLTLVTQIVGQFAIAIDTAALGLGLPDQFGLPRIFPRTVT
jgi:hypothetical protein